MTVAIIAAESGVTRGVSCSSTSNAVVGDGPIRSMPATLMPDAVSPVVHSGAESMGQYALRGKPIDGGGDPFVGGGQRDSHVMRATGSVELAGGDEDSALRKPRQGVAARLAAGGP